VFRLYPQNQYPAFIDGLLVALNVAACFAPEIQTLGRVLDWHRNPNPSAASGR
jgi:hypothetical protein